MSNTRQTESRFLLKVFRAFTLLLFLSLPLCVRAQGGLQINQTHVPGYTPEPVMPPGSVYAFCFDCTPEDDWRMLQMRLQFEKEQREQAALNNQDANYYAELELMMEQLKNDRAFMQELNSAAPTNRFEQQLMADPVFRTQIGLVQDALKSYRSPYEGWQTITINGVTTTPGFEAYVHGKTTATGGNQSRGHISQSKLERQINRESKSYQAYRNNPTVSSFLFWKSNERLRKTYEKCLRH